MQNKTNTQYQYVTLGSLFVYKVSIELCDLGWNIYSSLNWQNKKIMGDQFIKAVDSNAANIAEGYGRYYYLDRIKFYYNARASLLEAKHWAFLLSRRNIISKTQFDNFLKQANHVHYNLNKFIQSCYITKDAKR